MNLRHVVALAVGELHGDRTGFTDDVQARANESIRPNDKARAHAALFPIASELRNDHDGLAYGRGELFDGELRRGPVGGDLGGESDATIRAEREQADR